MTDSMPKEIGTYKLGDRIGGGGMGEVFRATDTRLGRTVALKFLKSATNNDRAEIRFLREARLAASIDHPFVCKVYEAGVHAGLHFLAMELVDGRSLQQLMREGELTQSQILRIAIEITEALEAAHVRGLMHRDLKPANVMITGHGHVKLLDFGLAKEFRIVHEERLGRPPRTDREVDADLTPSSETVGTLTYMAPEQVEGTSPDSRADLFALGILLHEALTGRHPFRKDSMQETLDSLLSEVPPFDGPLGSITGELRALVARLLAKPLDQRYQSAAEARADLRALVGPQQQSRFPWLQQPSVAVLPFESTGTDDRAQPFAASVAQEISSLLSCLEGVHVLAYASSATIETAGRSPAEIGSELDAEALLQGSVSCLENRVRVSVQLVEAQSSDQLWSRIFDRELDDIFALQDEVAEAVATEMQAHLSGAVRMKPLPRVRSTSLAAYSDYLKGQLELRKTTARGLDLAERSFAVALQHDPQYVPALVGKAQAHVLTAFWGTAPPKEAFPLAIEFLERALELDPRNPLALGVMGVIRAQFDWNRLEAERLFVEAIEAGPNLATTFYSWSSFLSHHGREEDALVAAFHAQQLDPLSPSIACSPGYALYFARRFEEAAEHFSGQVDVHGDLPIPALGLSLSLRELGRFEEALEVGGDLESMAGMVGRVSGAILRTNLGDEGTARQLLAELESTDSRLPRNFERASILVALGEHKRALDHIEGAVEGREPHVLTASVTPLFDPLHAHERFQGALAQLGLIESMRFRPNQGS